MNTPVVSQPVAAAAESTRLQTLVLTYLDPVIVVEQFVMESAGERFVISNTMIGVPVIVVQM